MKHLLNKVGFGPFLVTSAIAVSSLAMFSPSSTKKSSFQNVDFTELTRINRAVADTGGSGGSTCTPQVCSGSGYGCSIIVEGTTFSSSVCKQ